MSKGPCMKTNHSRLQSTYKNIIFDLGAVLIHWNPRDIFTKIFENEPNTIEQLLPITKTEAWSNLDKGVFTPTQCAENLAQTFDKEKVLKCISAVPAHLTPLQEGIEILHAVKQKGYKTYILSNMGEGSHKQIMHYDFLKEFDGSIFSYQVKHCKPEPEIYKKLLETYDLSPNECLFIDDVMANIKGAQEVGIDGILCSSHNFVHKEMQRLSIL